MSLFEEAYNPSNRLRAREDFADRVMQRIQQEQVSPLNSLSFGRRVVGIAAMFLMCVSLGIAIGANVVSGSSLFKGKSSIQEFQDIHHLSSPRDAYPFPIQLD